MEPSGVTVKGFRVSFGSDTNILKLIMVIT